MWKWNKLNTVSWKAPCGGPNGPCQATKWEVMCKNDPSTLTGLGKKLWSSKGKQLPLQRDMDSWSEWLFERWEGRAEWKRSEILLTNGPLTSLTDTIEVFQYQIKNSFSFHHSLMCHFSFLFILSSNPHSFSLDYVVHCEEWTEWRDRRSTGSKWENGMNGWDRWAEMEKTWSFPFLCDDTREKKRLLLYSCATPSFILPSRSVLCGCG